MWLHHALGHEQVRVLRPLVVELEVRWFARPSLRAGLGAALANLGWLGQGEFKTTRLEVRFRSTSIAVAHDEREAWSLVDAFWM